MIIKCKMCGGDIEFIPGATYGTCEYCGSTSTIPKADDESKLNRYNRANHFRRQCEFDKAVAAYEKILEQDDTDAEAHWGAVISRFGIEYVEDPGTGRRIPTCHRVQPTSILADEDYKAAVQYAPDAESRRLYEEEAARIAEIQRGILAISQNEKPYDVFICYKETDDSGQRTHDSQWAQEVYYGLTEQGYKVFFSRITLEDKLGQEYEPYIFAALNSARVMLVIGSKPEYFSAVWVKNEWSRYLALMAKDRKRLLIPCYRDMDPYDLPDELSTLQSQDMSKIGFMQDLIRGIQKVLDVDIKAEQPRSAAQAAQGAAPIAGSTESANVTSLLGRAFMALEDGEFDRADEFAEQTLNMDFQNPRAYLVKLMVERKVRLEKDLAAEEKPLTDNGNYQKALRFAQSSLQAQLQGWNQAILDRIDAQRRAEEEQKRREEEAAAEQKRRKAEVRTAVQALEEQLSAQVRQYRVASAPVASLKTELSKQNNELQFARSRLSMLRDELSNLKGLFTGSKRRELELQITTESQRVQELEVNLQQTEARLASTEKVLPEEPDRRPFLYQIAQTYRQAGMYAEAYAVFAQIKGYKDVDSLLVAYEAKLKPFITVGSYVTFGTYPQTSSGNDQTPIEWLVLDVQGNKSLLISRYGLDVKPYNEKSVDITWEKSTLRTWLNGIFLNKRFTAEEQKGILLTNVDNGRSQGHSKWSTNGGNNTKDKIFLLSYAEANKYLGVTPDNSTKTKSRVAPTAYALKQGASTSSFYGTADGTAAGWWWLRSPGTSQNGAANVIRNGSLSSFRVDGGNGCVRPALWINLESDVFWSSIF